MKKVVIVGGGIAGLATAYYLHESGRGAIDYALIESAPTFGGKIVSARENGFVVEGGPDSFLTTKPAALELCRALGLDDQLIGTNDAGRQVFVWSRGKLRPMPDGVMLIVPTKFMPFVTSSLISLPGKIRMGMDAIIPPRRYAASSRGILDFLFNRTPPRASSSASLEPESNRTPPDDDTCTARKCRCARPRDETLDGDESLAHFVRRRLGAEALDRIAEPMIAGIYVADAENLSLKSTFPRFLDMEKKYGSLIRGALQQRRATNGKTSGSGASATSMFMTLGGGLQQMTDAIVTRLNREALMPNRRVVAVTREGNTYALTLNAGPSLRADRVVFATPAYVTADLVQNIAPALADALRAIRYVSTATVSLGYKRSELHHPLDGFGFVVPRSEKRKIIACSWSSTKFNYRAGEGYALLRAFIGGAQAEYLAEQDEETLAQMARDELRAMMGITATPVLTKIYRWSKANPQYEVGHQERVAQIERLAAQHAGLYLAGAAYHGVGVPDCIADGARAAEEILHGG